MYVLIKKHIAIIGMASTKYCKKKAINMIIALPVFPVIISV